jgi:5'-nucleotidase
MENKTILLVNDDGYFSEGILLLKKVLQKHYRKVVIVAPDRNLSGAGHALTFTKPLRIREVNRDIYTCLLYTSPSPRDRTRSRMPSSA